MEKVLDRTKGQSELDNRTESMLCSRGCERSTPCFQVPETLESELHWRRGVGRDSERHPLRVLGDSEAGGDQGHPWGICN